MENTTREKKKSNRLRKAETMEMLRQLLNQFKGQYFLHRIFAQKMKKKQLTIETWCC